MFTMTTQRTLLAGCMLTLALSAPISATADDEGCAGATLRPHLDRLDGWSVAAFQAMPSGGVRVAMDLEDGGRTLLIAMTVGDAGVNTFQMTRGKEGDSSLAPDVAERLTAMYRAIGEDSKVLACDRLKGAPPPPDQVYSELEELFRSLYQSSESTGAKGGVSVTLLVVVAAVVLVLAGVVFLTGALLLEVLDGWIAVHYGENSVPYIVGYCFEDGLEMIGVMMFITVVSRVCADELERSGGAARACA